MYYVLEEDKGLIGDLYVRQELRTAERENLLIDAALEPVMTHSHRIEDAIADAHKVNVDGQKLVGRDRCAICARIDVMVAEGNCIRQRVEGKGMSFARSCGSLTTSCGPRTAPNVTWTPLKTSYQCAIG